MIGHEMTRFFGGIVVAMVIMSLSLMIIPASDAGLIEQNPWDNLTRSGWIYGGDPAGSYAIDSASGSPQGNALRCTFNAGFPAGVEPCVAEYDIANRNEIYYGYWFKLSSNFQFHPVSQKLSFFWHNGGAGLIHDWVTEWGVGCIAGDCGPFKFGLRADQLNSGQNYGGNQPYSPTIQRNRWYWVEVHMVMNTPGVANGLLEVWIDNQLYMHYTTVGYRRSGQTGGWSYFQHAPTWGGTGGTVSETQHLWFDQTTISTTRIGMPGEPTPDTTPPAPPWNLTAK